MLWIGAVRKRRPAMTSGTIGALTYFTPTNNSATCANLAGYCRGIRPPAQRRPSQRGCTRKLRC